MLNARPLDTAGGGPSSSAWWLALGLLVLVLIGTAALLFMRQRRRQETALCAEWLERSAPRSGASEEAMPRWGVVTPAPSSARLVATGRSTPRPSERAMDSAPASRPSRMSPPASERQWLSQRPPRSSKEPT